MKKKEIFVFGVYVASDSYPNSYWLISSLVASGKFKVNDFSFKLKKKRFSSKVGLLKKLFFLAEVSLLNFLMFLRIITNYHKANFIFIPYPSIFLVMLFSAFKAKRHKVTVDFFISIYDTVVVDRNLFNENSLAAKFIYNLEKFTLKNIDVAIVDTGCNAKYYSELFSLDIGKFTSLPLMINEDVFRPSPFKVSKDKFEIIFFGSMSPLHGVDKIIDVAKILKDSQDNYHFTIIGTGQCDSFLNESISEAENITWIDSWLESGELYKFIIDSDICMGIFGNTDKTKRVWPYKNYLAMSSSKPIITSEFFCLPGSCPSSKDILQSVFTASEVEDICKAIIVLCENESLRKDLSIAAHNFYRNNLSNNIALEYLADIIFHQ